MKAERTHIGTSTQLYIQTLKIRQLSPLTQKIYAEHFTEFVHDIFPLKPEDLSLAEINSYVSAKNKKNKYGESVFRQKISAIKYYYEKILGRPKMYFKYRQELEINQIPTRFSYEQLKPCFRNMKSPSDKLLLFLIYFAGMNAGRLSGMKLSDFKHFYAFCRKSYLPEVCSFLRKTVAQHYRKIKPEKYLFEKKSGDAYTPHEIRIKALRLGGKYKMVFVYRKQLENLLNQSSFSSGTKRNYISYFLSFLKYFNFRHPALIGIDSIAQFFDKKNFSESTQNNYINALKFYYRHALNRKLDTGRIKRAKRKRDLPKILSKAEISALIAQIRNIKHKALISLIYSAGLRRGEALRLKVSDIDSQRMQIRINGGKGKKDRVTLLSEEALHVLREYYRIHRPSNYLFEGASGGEYSASSASKVLKRAARKAGIKRNVNLHMLRHSFATHLVDDGVDIRIVQFILGHESIKTTERYTHVSTREIRRIVSPLDKIKENMNKIHPRAGP